MSRTEEHLSHNIAFRIFFCVVNGTLVNFSFTSCVGKIITSIVLRDACHRLVGVMVLPITRKLRDCWIQEGDTTHSTSFNKNARHDSLIKTFTRRV